MDALELTPDEIMKVRLECLEMVSLRANELTQRNIDVSPEMMERWAVRMVNFVVYGAFDPAEQAFVARMTEPVV
jgi:hypothetical protein